MIYSGISKVTTCYRPTLVEQTEQTVSVCARTTNFDLNDIRPRYVVDDDSTSLYFE